MHNIHLLYKSYVRFFRYITNSSLDLDPFIHFGLVRLVAVERGLLVILVEELLR